MRIVAALLCSLFGLSLVTPGAAARADREMGSVWAVRGAIPSVHADWAKFHFNARNTGSNPYEDVIGPQNVSLLTELWGFKSGAAIHSAPAVVQDVVYFGSDDA